MISPVLAHILLALIVGFSIVLMLVRPRNIPEVYWIAERLRKHWMSAFFSSA